MKIPFLHPHPHPDPHWPKMVVDPDLSSKSIFNHSPFIRTVGTSCFSRSWYRYLSSADSSFVKSGPFWPTGSRLWRNRIRTGYRELAIKSFYLCICAGSGVSVLWAGLPSLGPAGHDAVHALPQTCSLGMRSRGQRGKGAQFTQYWYRYRILLYW
jgi:hypothetical protein